MIIKISCLFYAASVGAATSEPPTTIAPTEEPDVTTQEPGILFCSFIPKPFGYNILAIPFWK